MLAGGPKRRGRKVGVIVAVIVAVVAALGGGGAYAWVAFHSSGDQPERHLPAGTAAMVKIDLDPSAEQKLQALRFATKLPASTSTSRAEDSESRAEDSDLRRTVYEQLIRDAGHGWPNWSEVEPWLGERAALAVVPAGGGSKPIPVLALQVTDEQRAATTLRGMRTTEQTGAAVGDGWAYVSDSTAHAEDVLTQARAKALDADPAFASDRDDLGGEGIAAAWFDAGRLQSAVRSRSGGQDDPDAGRSGLPDLPGLQGRELSGRGAVVLRFTGADLEVAGSLRTSPDVTLSARGTGVEQLPEDAVVAAGMAGAGDLVAEQWRALAQEGPDGEPGPETMAGLRLPEDLQALFGQAFAVAVVPDVGAELPQIGVRATSSSPRLKAALDAVTRLAEEQRLSLQQRTIPGGYVLANTPGQADALVRGGRLGTSERFRRAVPDAASASSVVYVDLTRIGELAGSAPDAETAEAVAPFAAVGFSTGNGGDGRISLRLRLTTR